MFLHNLQDQTHEALRRKVQPHSTNHRRSLGCGSGRQTIGHGGKDPGALGKKIKEKDINLDIVLKLGEMITQNNPDVKVIYTRKKDVFVELGERARIANSNNADLFISVHTNAAKSKSAQGTETYALGLAKSEENLEVSKRENSVILLEDDYTTK